MAKGSTQEEGIDFLDTFSPVAKVTTIRTVLAIVACQNWFLHQLDINNSFLHGDLHEDMYIVLPPNTHQSLVWYANSRKPL